ncbi:DUF6509 family protein [Paenibacillus chartarius]|uniref:DUF6509 family protein n=1 Tax=Paenibacillus chartarius TaxID=747481 RepID=A0ABV6DJ34_9BACL
MFTITGHRAEYIRDPYGIVPGERYEFHLDLEVEEDDELFSEQGVYIRVIYGVQDGKGGIVKYELYEKGQPDKYLDFELEDEELAETAAYCESHLPGSGA